jgi:LPS-assembly protein
MSRVLFALLLLVSVALAGDKKIEFFATKVDSNMTSVHATGDVLVLYGDYYLSADEAVYNRQKGTLELFGDIIAMQGADYFAMGDYAKLNVPENSRDFSPFFLFDRKSSVWMSSLRSGSKDNLVQIDKGMVSGCNPNNPFWVLYFSSADYNTQSKWMNVYNAYLKLYGIPVFYFPYFGYSLDTRRRSGLLVPSFGVSSTEGFFYQQPVYIAVDPSWDLEVTPQIRTLRGEGIYGRLRFVDSNVSGGSLYTGYFREKSSYMQQYDLANSESYGIDFFYTNAAVLQRWLGWDLPGQSGLYADINWMTDVDYINLQSNDDVNSPTSNQVPSRLNLFYTDDDAYYGLNFRYYLDLSTTSNAQTLQNLPNANYHRYLDSFFDDHFYYTFDAKANNVFREQGVSATEGGVDMPLTLRTSALDDYLLLSYTAQLSGKYITFNGDINQSTVVGQGYNSGTFGRLYHVLNAGTQVSRAYDGFSHTMGFDATYTKAGVDAATGYYQEEKSLCSGADASLYPECDFYTINQVEDALDLQFSQFVVGSDGRQLFYQRIAQRVSFSKLTEQLSELENEVNWQVTPSVSLYSDVFYNYQSNTFSKMLNSVNYAWGGLQAGITDMYENTFTQNGAQKVNYVTLNASYNYGRHYRYFGRYAYDINSYVKKLSEIGFTYQKRCWQFGMRYVENNRPILTNNDASSVLDKYVYFTVMLRPIGGTEINYKLSDKLDGGY